MNFKISYSKLLTFFLIVKALLVLLLMVFSEIHLGPDEAQYWTWSQQLDWGYYSKPPGIAWQIKLGTLLFGHTELGVRIFSLFFSLIQTYLIYFLALRSNLKTSIAFWCALIMAYTPLGILGSFFAITDGGMLLCWTGACLTLVTALQKKIDPSPIAIGLWIMAGALFKWPIYVFWIFYLISHKLFFPNQSVKKIIQGIAISLVSLLPSAWWNYFHEGATFRHIFATIQGGSLQQAKSNFFEFVGAQSLLLSPIIFIILIVALLSQWKQRRTLSLQLLFCWFVTLSLLLFGTTISLIQKVQGNWVDFLYPTAIICIGFYVQEAIKKRLIWLKTGLLFSIFLTSLLLFLPHLYTHPLLTQYAPTFRFNPLKHNVGWESLSHTLESIGYKSDEHFLVSDKYQTTSLLSFYSPQHKRAYFLNLTGARKNQFCYWPSLLQDHPKGNGFFIWVENTPYLTREWKSKQRFYQERLRENFEDVKFIGMHPLVFQGLLVSKAALIYACKIPKHQQVQENDKY